MEICFLTGSPFWQTEWLFLGTCDSTVVSAECFICVHLQACLYPHLDPKVVLCQWWIYIHIYVRVCLQKQRLWGNAYGQMVGELLCSNIDMCDICTPPAPCMSVSVVRLRKNFLSVEVQRRELITGKCRKGRWDIHYLAEGKCSESARARAALRAQHAAPFLLTLGDIGSVREQHNELVLCEGVTFLHSVYPNFNLERM